MRVPRNIKEAYELDKHNGNNPWTLAIEQETTLLRDDFECFRAAQNDEITQEYQKIPLLWTFDVKCDGRHRARLVECGHVTEELENDDYSGVIDLETIRIVFLAVIFMGPESDSSRYCLCIHSCMYSRKGTYHC